MRPWSTRLRWRQTLGQTCRLGGTSAHPDRAERALDARPRLRELRDAANNVVAFCRAGEDPARDVVACVCNLSPVPRHGYRLGLPQAGRWRELINTDAEVYGGSNTGNFGGVDAEPTGWGGQPR
mgnify:CR=1 FL=1